MKKKTRIIDLSLMFHDGMQTYHKKYHPKFKRIKSATHKSHNREVSTIQIGSHLGTHIMLPDILSKMVKQLISTILVVFVEMQF